MYLNWNFIFEYYFINLNSKFESEQHKSFLRDYIMAIYIQYFHKEYIIITKFKSIVYL